jgi:hypothetical protein
VKLLRAAGLCAVVGCLWACDAGDRCEQAESGAVLARISAPLTLRKGVLRTREAVVGSLVADALWRGFNGDPAAAQTVTMACAQDGAELPCIDLAVHNAGGIRQDSACGINTEWREGPLHERDVEELLPFENDLKVLSLNGSELYDMFEQGFAALGQPGRFSWAGGFLHTAGAFVMLDCAGAPRSAGVDGDRVLGICLRRLSDAESNNDDWSLVSNSPMGAFRLAVNEFIAGGNDGFDMLVDVVDGVVVSKSIGINPPFTDQSLLKSHLQTLGQGEGKDFDPIARTRPPSLADDLCVVRLGAGDPRAARVLADPLCVDEEGEVVCRFDPRARITVLNRSICYP